MTKEQETIHTPGPWYACANGGDDSNTTKCYVATRHKQLSQTIADCSYPFEAEEMEANARLIAAAPELLGALQIAEVAILRLETRHGSFSSAQGTLDVIRAAIAKATGDSSL